MAGVVSLDKHDPRNIVAQLRSLASSIEAGTEPGIVASLVIIIREDATQTIFNWGENLRKDKVVYALEVSKHEIIKEILES